MTWQTPQLLQLHLETRRHKDKENGLYDWVLMAVTLRPCKRPDTQHQVDRCSRERKAVDRELKRGRGDLICLFFSSQWLSKKRMSKLNFDILIKSTCSACPQLLRSERCSLLGYWFHMSVFVYILLQISARVVLLPCLWLLYFVLNFFLYKNHSTPFCLRFIIWWVKGE